MIATEKKYETSNQSNTTSKVSKMIIWQFDILEFEGIAEQGSQMKNL